MAAAAEALDVERLNALFVPSANWSNDDELTVIAVHTSMIRDSFLFPNFFFVSFFACSYPLLFGLSLKFPLICACRIGYRADSLFFLYPWFFLSAFFGCFLLPFHPRFPAIRIQIQIRMYIYLTRSLSFSFSFSSYFHTNQPHQPTSQYCTTHHHNLPFVIDITT